MAARAFDHARKQTMTPRELQVELTAIVQNDINDPLLILGESGVGKSSIVRQVADEFGLPVYDVRWGQMAPIDVRGVPVPDHETKATEFYPPSFWPRKGPGIIFLDEFNMASPVMMGLGQQLLLDRQFGDYKVPDGVKIWAAGNRKTDMATVNTIPGPVQNRVAHYEVEHDLESWKLWAYGHGVVPVFLGFLDFRSELLHKPSKESMAWPSPRTWEIANRRYLASMSIEPAVGANTTAEFRAYEEIMKELPNIDLIAQGKGQSVKMASEPSLRFAIMAELTARSIKSWDTFTNCFTWAASKCQHEPEWLSTLVMGTIRVLKVNDNKKYAEFTKNLLKSPEIKRFISGQIG
jgi:hypothetical protein